MFGAIARRYDLANHTLSCGIDFYWRKRAANTVASWQPGKIVDLATGTGDLALALQKTLPDAEVTGVDFLPEMLELAQRKGVRQTILADAMKLPFPDASFDCVTIAFGLRNMENWRGALAEMSRVLRRDGHLSCAFEPRGKRPAETAALAPTRTFLLEIMHSSRCCRNFLIAAAKLPQNVD